METVRLTPHLRRGEVIAGISSVVLLVSLFTLHWLAQGPAGHSVARTGFQALTVMRWFLIVAGVLGLLVTVLQLAARAPALPAVSDMVTLTVSGVTTLLLVIRLLVGSGSVQAGAIVGLLACAAVTAGAFLALRAEDGWVPGPEHPVQTIRIDRAPGV